jgi:Ca2+-transporting ATPase
MINDLSTAHAMSANDAATRLQTNVEDGLSAAETDERTRKFGPNRLAEKPPEPLWKRFLKQFLSLMIGILALAAVVAGFLGEWVDSIAIMAIVVLNGVIGFVQEYQAEQALAALKSLAAPVAKVIRDGQLSSIPAEQLVPGDLIALEAGDFVPADARLVEAFSVATQEAPLTGESTSVEKISEDVLDEAAPLGERHNMVYLGTSVATGMGKAIVTATGMKTELGKIAGMLDQGHEEPTPLQKRLTELGRLIAYACFGIVVIVFGLQIWRSGGDNLAEAFMVSVSLAVAAVPEGLPTVVTIALALGVRRMVKRNALIRKLPSVETLGCVNVICSDKTGTLTRNEMTVREVFAGGHRYRFAGIGYAPTGEVHRKVEDDHKLVTEAPGHLTATLKAAAICNHAGITSEGEPAKFKVTGDPTEAALLVAAAKAGIKLTPAEKHIDFEIPFDSTRKRMAVVAKTSDGKKVLYAKGAPEVMLGLCESIQRDGHIEPITDADRQMIMRVNEEMAKQALRVLAITFRENLDGVAKDDLDQKMTFAGLVGMIDPPREEVKAAVEIARTAGVSPVMITGDHPITAMAIARELGIAKEGHKSLTGVQLDQYSDDQLASEIESLSVYARTSAEHKLRIVKAWKSKGHIVAMTGDGVNDAPAVKMADIGIALGITGSDVTKEASDMVLTDDNFTSIVGAVEEGRGIYDNIQNVLQFLLSCNFGEILLMLLASILGLPAPLIPIHLLWINLVTDGLPALALAMEKPDKDVMLRKPRSSRESILERNVSLAIAWQGSLVGGLVLFAFWYYYDASKGSEGLILAQAIAFQVLVFDELFRSFANRSKTHTLLELKPWTNPYLLAAVAASAALQLIVSFVPWTRDIFKLPLLEAKDWLFIFIMAIIPVTIIEVRKIIASLIWKT